MTAIKAYFRKANMSQVRASRRIGNEKSFDPGTQLSILGEKFFPIHNSPSNLRLVTNSISKSTRHHGSMFDVLRGGGKVLLVSLSWTPGLFIVAAEFNQVFGTKK